MQAQNTLSVFSTASLFSLLSLWLTFSTQKKSFHDSHGHRAQSLAPTRLTLATFLLQPSLCFWSSLFLYAKENKNWPELGGHGNRAQSFAPRPRGFFRCNHGGQPLPINPKKRRGCSPLFSSIQPSRSIFPALYRCFRSRHHIDWLTTNATVPSTPLRAT